MSTNSARIRKLYGFFLITEQGRYELASTELKKVVRTNLRGTDQKDHLDFLLYVADSRRLKKKKDLEAESLESLQEHIQYYMSYPSENCFNRLKNFSKGVYKVLASEGNYIKISQYASHKEALESAKLLKNEDPLEEEIEKTRLVALQKLRTARMLLDRNGMRNEAIQLCEESTALNPSHPLAYWFLSNFYFAMQEGEEKSKQASETAWVADFGACSYNGRGIRNMSCEEITKKYTTISKQLKKRSAAEVRSAQHMQTICDFNINNIKSKHHGEHMLRILFHKFLHREDKIDVIKETASLCDFEKQSLVRLVDNLSILPKKYGLTLSLYIWRVLEELCKMLKEEESSIMTNSSQEYTKALLCDPECFDSYYNRGIAYEKSGEFVKALKDYISANVYAFWQQETTDKCSQRLLGLLKRLPELVKAKKQLSRPTASIQPSPKREVDAQRFGTRSLF